MRALNFLLIPGTQMALEILAYLDPCWLDMYVHGNNWRYTAWTTPTENPYIPVEDLPQVFYRDSDFQVD